MKCVKCSPDPDRHFVSFRGADGGCAKTPCEICGGCLTCLMSSSENGQMLHYDPKTDPNPFRRFLMTGKWEEAIDG